MGRPRKNVEVEAPAEVPTIDDQALEVIHAFEQKWDKKAIEGKEINELIAKKNELIKFNSETSRDLAVKERALRFIYVDIQNAQKEVEKIRENFDKENAERVKALNEKQAKLDHYIQEYEVELARVRKQADGLDAKIGKFEEERKDFLTEKAGYVEYCEKETARINDLQAKANETIKTLEAKKKEIEKANADLLNDIKEVQKRKQELLSVEQKVRLEAETSVNARQDLELERQKIKAERANSEKEVLQIRQSYQERLASLKDTEKALKTKELELQVQEKEIKDLIKQYKLEEKLKK